jgi:hypothetical protein
MLPSRVCRHWWLQVSPVLAVLLLVALLVVPLVLRLVVLPLRPLHVRARLGLLAVRLL